MKSAFRNWQDVRVFLAVMRAGSTLAAAKELGMSQPTVARRIDVLEHETGLKLFRRDTRGACPTEDAKALLPAAEALETAAEAFSDQAARQAVAARRPIRITAGAPNFSPRMAAILAEFNEDHPDVTFEFVPSYRKLDLSAGEADIALRLAKTIDDPRLICRKISDAQFAFYGAPRYAERYGLPKGLDDLAGHRFAGFRAEGVTTRLHDFLMRYVTPDQVVTICDDIDTMLTAIQTGLGLGILNVGYAQRQEGLVQCFEPLAEGNMTHWLLVGPEAWERPEVKAFVRFFAPRYSAIFRSGADQPAPQR